MLRSLVLVFVATTFVACASSGVVDAIDPQMRIVRVTDAALRPKAEVEIDLFGAVCWLNDDEERVHVSVAIDDRNCLECAKTVNFFGDEDGVRTPAITYGRCAVLSFFECGEYEYLVESGTRRFRGKVRVVDRRAQQ